MLEREGLCACVLASVCILAADPRLLANSTARLCVSVASVHATALMSLHTHAHATQFNLFCRPSVDIKRLIHDACSPFITHSTAHCASVHASVCMAVCVQARTHTAAIRPVLSAADLPCLLAPCTHDTCDCDCLSAYMRQRVAVHVRAHNTHTQLQIHSLVCSHLLSSTSHTQALCKGTACVQPASALEEAGYKSKDLAVSGIIDAEAGSRPHPSVLFVLLSVNQARHALSLFKCIDRRPSWGCLAWAMADARSRCVSRRHSLDEQAALTRRKTGQSKDQTLIAFNS